MSNNLFFSSFMGIACASKSIYPTQLTSSSHLGILLHLSRKSCSLLELSAWAREIFNSLIPIGNKHFNVKFPCSKRSLSLTIAFALKILVAYLVLLCLNICLSSKSIFLYPAIQWSLSGYNCVKLHL